jgi:hypothetical protein
MQSIADRRAFVRHMVVGLPVIAGATSFPGTVDGFTIHEPLPLSLSLETMLRDLARVHNEMRRRGTMTRDDLRALATQTRLLAADRLTANRDGELMRGIRQVIAREGRDTILDHPVDPNAMRGELASLGFELGMTNMAMMVDRPRREDALERLARGGLSPAYMEAWSDFEGLDVMMMLAVTGGASSICTTLKDMERMLDAMVAVLCPLSVILPPAIPDCFAASSVLAAIKLITFLAC